jgi:hypothetical protein
MAMQPKFRMLLISLITTCAVGGIFYKLISKQDLIDKCLNEGGQ